MFQLTMVALRLCVTLCVNVCVCVCVCRMMTQLLKSQKQMVKQQAECDKQSAALLAAMQMKIDKMEAAELMRLKVRNGKGS
jgi:hypothetical protein